MCTGYQATHCKKRSFAFTVQQSKNKRQHQHRIYLYNNKAFRDKYKKKNVYVFIAKDLLDETIQISSNIYAICSKVLHAIPISSI